RVSVVFAGLIAVVLGLSQVAFAGGTVNQGGEPTSKNASLKSTRKKKKRKSSASSIIVLGAYAQPTITEQVSSLPAASSPVAVNATPPAPAATRSTLKMLKTPSVHVSPVEDPPANVATAGQLVISEFRVRGPSGANDEFIEIENVSGS